MRNAAIFILSLPLLLLAVAWFCLVAPLMMVFAVPIWGLLSIIDMLKGDDPMFFDMVKSVFLMGFDMYGETTGFYSLDL